jgi:MOSC domain-containing protein YiiM
MTVHSINVSNGGVPKLPRTSAWVGVDRVEGDRQRDLRFHGGPQRAVAIYSLDLIRQLQAEGHPIAPGTIGENLTIDRVDWSQMTPGTRVQVGEVELEITSYTAPCNKIRESFLNDDFTRVSQKVHPGWSRVYAKVLQEGRITIGDSVTVARTL